MRIVLWQHTLKSVWASVDRKKEKRVKRRRKKKTRDGRRTGNAKEIKGIRIKDRQQHSRKERKKGRKREKERKIEKSRQKSIHAYTLIKKYIYTHKDKYRKTRIKERTDVGCRRSVTEPQ